MTDEPEALRLADTLEFGVLLGDDRDLAAAELRRLHGENADLREAARMALIAEADAVVDQLRALHRATMGYEDACVLRGAELVADALREALGDAA